MELKFCIVEETPKPRVHGRVSEIPEGEVKDNECDAMTRTSITCKWWNPTEARTSDGCNERKLEAKESRSARSGETVGKKVSVALKESCFL